MITGSVEHFANRKEVKEEIEKRGGKVTGSVTSKTSYLINNDTRSASSKIEKDKRTGNSNHFGRDVSQDDGRGSISSLH